jgi:hypothetical protein
MGILDEAIRDHLELKRKGGTREADLRRLEDEAFGARGLPGEPASGVAVPTQAPESPESESAPGEWPEERSEADASEEGDVPEAEAPPGAQVAFHDFAAEEGLVGPRADAASPVEGEEMAPAPPTDEIAFDDSEPQEMPTELRAPGEGPPAEAAEVEETEIDYDLELTLDDEDLEPSGGLREGTEEDAEGGEPPSEPELTVVEEEEEVVEGEIEEIEVDEPGGEEAPGDEGEDVLEETPDFLRETPEHDRLWFEQKPPKDFDFDD